jgi:glutaredoxin
MDELALRLFVVVALVVVAVAAARATRAWQDPTHPPVDLTGTGLPTGVLVFTSSECVNCKAVRAALEELDVPFREVTWELEPGMFETWGIESVPLVVARDASGATVAQLSGKPSRRRLRSLVASLSGPSVADP